VPIENTLAGSVNENYDLLSAHALHVIARPSAHPPLPDRIPTDTAVRRAPRRVTPGGAGAVSRFFTTHPDLVAVPALRHRGQRARSHGRDGGREAAIASKLAAELYGAAVLEEGLEDHAENYTRFLVIARDPASREARTRRR